MSHDPQQNPAAEPGWTEIGDDAQYERVILQNMHFSAAEEVSGPDPQVQVLSDGQYLLLGHG
jgi:hypothetical protein